MLRSDRKTRNPREESTVTRTQERITGYGWRATLFPHQVKNRSSLRVVVKMRWMGFFNGITIVSCFKQETSALLKCHTYSYQEEEEAPADDECICGLHTKARI